MVCMASTGLYTQQDHSIAYEQAIQQGLHDNDLQMTKVKNSDDRCSFTSFGSLTALVRAT